MACLGLLEVFQMCIDFEVCSIDFKVYRSLGWEDPLEEGMAAHSSILAGESPWTEVPGRVQSMGSQRVGHNRVTKHSTQQQTRNVSFKTT